MPDLRPEYTALAESLFIALSPMHTKAGNLQWKIAVRANGTLAYDGVFPILIQWAAVINPVEQMQDQGLPLEKPQLQYPQATIINSAL